jgi:hypothetical protein
LLPRNYFQNLNKTKNTAKATGTTKAIRECLLQKKKLDLNASFSIVLLDGNLNFKANSLDRMSIANNCKVGI